MVINVFGRRGSGKTTTIKGQLNDCRSPVLIVDVLGNFDDESYYQTDDLSDAIAAAGDYAAKPQEENPIICLSTSNPTLAAEYLSAAIWRLNGGTLILDEVDSIRIKEGSCFDEYIRYGRNHFGDLITGCRRPAELDRNITAAANKFYCFQTHEMRDIEYFRSIFGDKAFELMKVPRYSGLFIDYDREITGKFCIDINGTVYHTEEYSIT